MVITGVTMNPETAFLRQNTIEIKEAIAASTLLALKKTNSNKYTPSFTLGFDCDFKELI